MFTNKMYQKSHKVVALAFGIAIGFALTIFQPWGWPMAIAVSIIICILLYKIYKKKGIFSDVAIVLLGMGVATIILAITLLPPYPITQFIVWGITAIAVTFWTVEVFFGSPPIASRFGTAMIIFAFMLFLGAVIAQAIKDWSWILYVLGSPLYAKIWKIVTKE